MIENLESTVGISRALGVWGNFLDQFGSLKGRVSVLVLQVVVPFSVAPDFICKFYFYVSPNLRSKVAWPGIQFNTRSISKFFPAEVPARLFFALLTGAAAVVSTLATNSQNST